MTPAALLADPEGLEVMLVVAGERSREAKRAQMLERLHAGESGVASG